MCSDFSLSLTLCFHMCNTNNFFHTRFFLTGFVQFIDKTFRSTTHTENTIVQFKKSRWKENYGVVTKEREWERESKEEWGLSEMKRKFSAPFFLIRFSSRFQFTNLFLRLFRCFFLLLPFSSLFTPLPQFNSKNSIFSQQCLMLSISLEKITCFISIQFEMESLRCGRVNGREEKKWICKVFV